MPYKDFQTIGTISPDDVDSVVRDADSMFGWRPLDKSSIYVGDLDVSSIYVLTFSGIKVNVSRASLVVGNDAHDGAIPIRQSDYQGRKTRLRIHAIVVSPPGVPSCDLDIGLFPFAQEDPFGPAGQLQAKIAPSAVPGSAVRITNTPSAKIQHYYSGEFLIPQSGLYFLGATPLVSRTALSPTLIYLNTSYKRVP